MRTWGRVCVFVCVSMWWHPNDWMNLLGICRNVILNQQTIFRMWHSIWCVSVSLSFFLCAFFPFSLDFSFSISFNASFGALGAHMSLSVCVVPIWRENGLIIYALSIFFINFFPAFSFSYCTLTYCYEGGFSMLLGVLGAIHCVSFRLAHQLTIEYWTVTQCNLNDDS